MADLERDLKSRLSRLADAVPVGRGHLDPVHRTAVAARHDVRLAWLTPLVVLVVGGLLVGLTKLGQPAPGASAVAGPIEATDTKGAFSLTITSAKAVYRPDEPIDVAASLTFAGPDLLVRITHGLGVNGGPLGFGVVEPVDVPGVGLIQLGGGYRLACTTSTLPQDAPIGAPYSKGGSPLLDPPDGPTFEQLQAYMSDRVLRLPAGTWHVYAIAEFATGNCAPGMAGSERYSLRSEIVVVVADDPSATPGPPQPTSVLNKPVYGGDDIGDFTLQLKAGHSTYIAGQPIDVSAWYTYGSGINNTITVNHFTPEMAYSISQVADDATVVREILYDSACQELTLADGVERHVPLIDSNVTTIRAVSWPPSTVDALKEGTLQLPVGRWRITAVVQTSIGPCGAPREPRQLHASIEIDVVAASDSAAPTPSADQSTPPDSTATIKLWTASAPDAVCAQARMSGRLALDPHSGLGVADDTGDVQQVRWPFGYTARRELGVAVLVDPTGQIVGHEGRSIVLGGAALEGGAFYACTGIRELVALPGVVP